MPQHNQILLIAAHKGIPVEDLLVEVLNSTNTLNEAAAELGVSYATLYKHMREYGINSETVYYAPPVPHKEAS